MVLGLAVVRHADSLQATGSRSGARPTRGYSVDLAERASTSTAFFEPEPGLNEEGKVVRVRGVFEPDDPKDMHPDIAEDFWEPYVNSPRMDSDHLSPDRLRSSDLNDLLQPDFMEQKRFGISPMQAIGAVFKDETVLSGMDELNKESWRAVAKYNNLPPPDDDHMELAMGMLPERAIQQTFMWTDDWGETKRWSAELLEAHARMLPEANFTATPGAVDWLTALNEYQVPCVVCSSVARAQVVTMLEKAGLSNMFQEIVAADDGCETQEQAYLLASLKLKRPPMKCVVFADEPKEVSIAHETTAKAIAVVSKHSGNGGLRRDFSHADLRVGGLDELRISQLKEVADREPEESWMVPELQPEPFWGPGD
jgi:beta-phosphoglucomutase-like phosphatase (HAD superfamily)